MNEFVIDYLKRLSKDELINLIIELHDEIDKLLKQGCEKEC